MSGVNWALVAEDQKDFDATTMDEETTATGDLTEILVKLQWRRDEKTALLQYKSRLDLIMVKL